MSEIMAGVGRNIRAQRKKRDLTLDELSKLVNKSKSTLSKYENGEISVDIETLYELADAFHVHVEQLLYVREGQEKDPAGGSSPSFFSGVTRFYSCLYDGRSRQLLRSVFDVLSQSGENRYKIMMYMNYRDPVHYQNCETTYCGYIEHFDAISNIILINQDSPMEHASAQILASYLDSDMKWGLWNGLSSRPMMPIAAKMLFTKKPISGDESVVQELKISREDIRLLKLYNMFPVI